MDDNLIWSAYHTRKCCENSPICPTTIASCGFESRPEMNQKCYIAFGDTCYICMDPITSKTNAWLTPCGHQFHRKCVITNHVYRQTHGMTLEFSNEIPCPVCREGLVNCCVGIDDLDKYHRPKNKLDVLENFWLSITFAPYVSCYKCDKGMGMTINCDACEKYRKTGRI